MFSKTDKEDLFVNQILNGYCKNNNIRISKVKNEIESKYNKKYKQYSISNLLYSSLKDNIIEEILFNDYIQIDVNNPLFNDLDFYKLKKHIIYEHKSLFPLRDGYTRKEIIKINWFIVPSKSFQKLPDILENCLSAGVTSTGEMVFNRNFCEKLCLYAQKKGVKPSGNKYISNGGYIPDYYCYIEFLILHEFYHIIHGDTFYTKKFKNLNKEVENIVGDFIINYKLIKKGYLQPPIGLFNMDINYEKQKTIEEMRDIVIEEMERISDSYDCETFQSVQSSISSLDEHMEQDIDEENQVDDSSSLDNSINENIKNSEEMEKDIDEESQEKVDDGKKESGDQNNGENTNTQKTSFQNIILNTEYKPTYNWSQILKKLLPSSSKVEEFSYSTISRKTISSLHQLKDTGISSSKPGIISIEDDKKGIFFIIDNSGSVFSELQKIHKDILALINKNKTNLIDMYVIKFDTKFSFFKLDLSKNSYGEIYNIDNFLNNKYESPKPLGGIINLFTDDKWGGGTIFSSKIVEISLKLWKENYNVILFSDTDIIYEKSNLENLENLSKQFSRRKDSFAIITNKKSYKDFKQLGLKNVLLSSF